MAESQNVKQVCAMISMLTLDEMCELRDVLRRQWGDDWSVGTREPRRPIPSAGEPGDALEEPFAEERDSGGDPRARLYGWDA